ncbi:MAG: ROK family protein [Balneolaceae bacterium]|nr:MAG: ROK family protein [Balneolaceae bacterium]
MIVAAGIDIGGTETKIGFVNRDGDMLAFTNIATNAERGYKAFLKQLQSEITVLIDSLSAVSLVGIGIAAPTGSYQNGTIENASNLGWPRNLPVCDLLGSYFDVPAVISNDANAAAVGEMLYGVAQGVDNFICITLGTGLGSGIVADGKLLLGADGHAGELGHFIAVPNGRPCACGRNGCLETYASATGIVKTYLQLSEKISTHTPSENNSRLTAKNITKAALAGDENALKAFEITGEILGKKLADAISVLNPELIVLNGGLSRAGDLILLPTRKHLEENLLNIYNGTVEVKISKISSKKSAVLGAAAFMWLKLDEVSEEATKQHH